jgi:hypothetical protein
MLVKINPYLSIFVYFKIAVICIIQATYKKYNESTDKNKNKFLIKKEKIFQRSELHYKYYKPRTSLQ